MLKGNSIISSKSDGTLNNIGKLRNIAKLMILNF